MTTNENTEFKERMNKLQEQSSMDYWWPKLKEIDVPTPETIRLEIVDKTTDVEGFPVPLPNIHDLHAAIKQVDGPPAFLRSDVTSNKHDMAGSSKIRPKDNPKGNVIGVMNQHHLAMGMPMPNSFYVREWLDLYHEYKSFSDSATPISAECRVFLLDGEIHDCGFYWPMESVWEHSVTKDNWRELHEKTERIALNGKDVFFEYARIVATEFNEGYWSLDFALSEGGTWYAIDMARGELSWHPEGIEKAVSDPRDP